MQRLQGQDDDAVGYSHQDGNDTSGATRPPRLMYQVSERIRQLGLLRRTEQAYRGWMQRFILANGKRHPRWMGAAELEAFLIQLATRLDVAASTQNQALAALLFFYRQVLGIDPPRMTDVQRAKRPGRVRVALSCE